MGTYSVHYMEGRICSPLPMRRRHLLNHSTWTVQMKSLLVLILPRHHTEFIISQLGKTCDELVQRGLNIRLSNLPKMSSLKVGNLSKISSIIIWSFLEQSISIFFFFCPFESSLFPLRNQN